MRSMVFRCAVVAVAFGAMQPAFAKDHDDAPMIPPYILRARTVAVVIDPAAAVSVRDPNANQTARKDVETALLKWGRLEPVLNASTADLVILIRKGRKAADVGIADPRQNRRGGMVDPWKDGIAVGVQRGQAPSRGQPGAATTPTAQRPEDDRPVQQTGTQGDVFQVFQGGSDEPLDGVPGWMYVKKDALHAHDVPAVDAFRKAIDDAEKQAGQTQKKHP